MELQNRRSIVSALSSAIVITLMIIAAEFQILQKIEFGTIETPIFHKPKQESNERLYGWERAQTYRAEKVLKKRIGDLPAAIKRIEQYNPEILDASLETGVPADYLKALILLSSKGDPMAFSVYGHRAGLCLLPCTVQGSYGIKVNTRKARQLLKQRRNKIRSRGRLQSGTVMSIENRLRQTDDRFNARISILTTARKLASLRAYLGESVNWDIAFQAFLTNPRDAQEVVRRFTEGNHIYRWQGSCFQSITCQNLTWARMIYEAEHCNPDYIFGRRTRRFINRIAPNHLKWFELEAAKRMLADSKN